MPVVVSWSSIELLHNVVRTFTLLQTNVGTPPPVVSYRSKVKLHGTNCAVQILSGGVQCQGRTALLSPESDYKGFAAWVHEHLGWWSALPEGLVVYGEWCGPGVEKGMAISALPRKVFALFGLQVGLGAEARLVVDPLEIASMLPEGAPDALYVLPWEGDAFTIDFGSRDSLEQAAEMLSARVIEVEAQDPWVMRTFGISGVGEGLVLYPVSSPGGVPVEPAAYASWMFKAKGEKHRTVGASRAVQPDATAVEGASAFAALMLTEARLMQGLAAVCSGERDPRKTGAFLAWVQADVRKESVAELEASGLQWSDVERAVTNQARAWFVKR